MSHHDLFSRWVRASLNSKAPLLLFILALASGLIGLELTPREEEPQIVVPMLDVQVDAPGLTAKQVERQVTIPLEKLLSQIPGVEHVYSSSSRGQGMVTLRFFVGEDREDSILNTYNKLYSNTHLIPPVVERWQVRPVEVDDVAILVLGIWSDSATTLDDFGLRRLAQELSTELQAIHQTSSVEVVGGRSRTATIYLNPERLAAHRTSATEVLSAIGRSNRLADQGVWTLDNRSFRLESGDALREVAQLRSLVVNVIDGTPILLGDVAHIEDGPSEATHYSWFMHKREAGGLSPSQPMVVLSIAKQPGSNAVAVSRAVQERLEVLKRNWFPPGVQVQVLRDYGATADEKVNSLTSNLAMAVLIVIVFIGLFLGWRPALVVGLAVPVCYGVTLGLDLAFGYTINRVTLFALILALGLLVDDPITGADNIERHLRRSKGSRSDRIVAAMAEIRVPLLMSTLTIVLAFLPLGFITGMMGPYMAPMAFNVPLSVIMSTLVAFMITPWMAGHLLHPTPASAPTGEGRLVSAYKGLLVRVLDSPRRAKALLWVMLLLFLVAASLPLLRAVPLKLLPYDNKNEVQVLIDLPEDASLESTAATTSAIAAQVLRLAEVESAAGFVGLPSPFDFNGMVRRYYLRQQPHQAELRLVLVDKALREQQSHALVLRLRELLAPMARDGVSIKVVEVPPGPPVMSTLVAEIYGDPLAPARHLEASARTLMERLALEPHVVEVDSTLEASQPLLRFVADKQKAALAGISTQTLNDTLAIANQGVVAGYILQPREAAPLPALLRIPQASRADPADYDRLLVKGEPGVTQQSRDGGLDRLPQPLVALGELGEWQLSEVEKTIHHKDLRPVVYVTAELSGRTPAEVIADLNADQLPSGSGDRVDLNGSATARNWQQRSFVEPGAGLPWRLTEGTELSWSGEGEWRITVRVFRDMGIAFAFALVAIFIVLRIQTGSVALALIIMSAIPLTVIGIMPGFWLLNQLGERTVAGAPDPVLFTATAMIGMIALAGIVVRNSLILIEFITQARAQGMAIREALLEAGSVRMRPVLLTAGTTLLGNLAITLDPVFNGLALAIIFGIIASTLFTLLVVPVVYQLAFDHPTRHEAQGRSPAAPPLSRPSPED
ncbi:efflux RND transporter permease subunit [Aestuariirhabdus litorea]|uniref:Efflux RND transporter permease subunit n=1 Tax=Aestuariirhabdus litorea TaxID=2528527 RepID=A0A3P3VSP9_9GAMM|nr:efflux RND transporter permease subunit [Aestuariirhabdus litorea]RRJ84716.1 efflux RND transporter permease subunit [Aestuariirhabdus litorea]RWW97941.1 efflux RND transporter permease subunit [Endozoicomonadaceae bacterium GTF-13]